ncbi:MAG: urate hydroxylase PuuD [Sedimenticolaceae bacterium]
MNILKNPWQTAGAGIVLAIILNLLLGGGGGVNGLQIVTWIHVVVGIMWIGLLYYFNFVQVPAVNVALVDGDPGPAAINKYVAPRALLYFRWAALLTWLTGLIALAQLGGGIQGIVDAFLLRNGMSVIGVGSRLGTIMLFNVWVLIWPNQQKILGLIPATAEAVAQAKVTALNASRINTLLSIPMLMAMTGYMHGLPF